MNRLKGWCGERMARGDKQTLLCLLILPAVALIPLSASAANNDYDGDGISDLAVYRPSTGTWYVVSSAWPNSSPPQMTNLGGREYYRQWGLPGDIPVPGEYSGDGLNDFAVLRPSNWNWYLRWSNYDGWMSIQFGLWGDYLAQADYDNDGKTDLAVFRLSENRWYWRKSSTGTIHNEPANLPSNWVSRIPLPGNYGLDDAAERVLYVKSGTDTVSWWRADLISPLFSQSGSGFHSHIPVAGDYDGNGITDFARYNPSNGQWLIYIWQLDQWRTPYWGASGAVPIAGDFDDDGKDDLCYWLPNDPPGFGTWYVFSSGYPNKVPPHMDSIPGVPGGYKRLWGAYNDIPLGSLQLQP